MVDMLAKSYARVNRKYFGGRIRAQVSWDVPRVVLAVPLSDEVASMPMVPKVGSTDFSIYERAITALQTGQVEDARSALQLLAQAGYGEPQKLLGQLLTRTAQSAEEEREAAEWLRRHAARFNTVTKVPAACYYYDEPRIAVHPYLRDKQAPQYVLDYLIFHEGLHEILGSSADDPHSAEFRSRELEAPHRARAHAWLKEHKFPVFEVEAEADAVC